MPLFFLLSPLCHSFLAAFLCCLFTYFIPLSLHLPSLSSLPVSLCLSLLSLSFLPSLRLHMVQSCMSEQQTARQQQSARAASCTAFTKQSPGEAALKSSALLSSLLCVSLQIPLSILPGHPLCFSARLSGRHTQRTAAASPTTSSNWVSLLFSFHLTSPLLLILPFIISVRFCPVDLTNELSLCKVKAEWLTDAGLARSVR